MIQEIGYLVGGYITALSLLTSFNHYKNKHYNTTFTINFLALFGIGLLLMIIGVKNSVTFFVALMLLASQLKLFQAQTEKQFMQVFVLNFFTIPCLFIFSQNILTALLVFALIGLNLALMLMLQYGFKFPQACKNAYSKLTLTIPLSILLVLFIPKLPAFWQLPGPSLAKTGLSENVDPFEISQLSESDELVFRAIFNSQQVGPFYWRALVHDSFEGSTWNMSSLQNVPARFLSMDTGLTYKIIAEPSNLPWLFSLGRASLSHEDIRTNIFAVPYRTGLSSSAIEYDVKQAINANYEQISSWQYRQNTQFPTDSNIQTIALAKQWDQETQTTAQFVEKVKNYFLENGFIYTLSPPINTSANKIDEFLFENKAGFCGHYASSVAMMMRSVGIPARLVSGYLGGEYNVDKGYYSIRQYDAHAWLEYYVPNEGWVMLDPTAWVSPERLLGSLSQHSELSEELKDNFGVSLLGLSDIQVFNWLRVKFEEFDYQWTRWVLNFDDQKQSSFLKALFGKNAQFIAGVIAIVSLVIIFALLFLFIQRNKKTKLPKVVEQLQSLKKVSDLSFEQNTTPKQIILSLKDRYPSLAQSLDDFYASFEKQRYQNMSGLDDTSSVFVQLSKKIKKLNKRKV